MPDINLQITQDRLRSVLCYDPKTGIFTKSGQVAGSRNWSGYLRVMIDGKSRRLHRLAFLYMTGRLPPSGSDVDHINQDKQDNRWLNLRIVSRRENMRNAKRSRANSSGHTGVAWDRANDKWMAQIMVDGKCIKLGRFNDKADAVESRQQAELKYSFHANHGHA